MKERKVSNKSFIKNVKNFEKRVHKYIDESLTNHKTLKSNVSQMVLKLINSYKRNPYRKMSGFVHNVNKFDLHEIKVWYEFDFENEKLIFKFSEKRLTNSKRRFKRKVQLVLKYSDILKPVEFEFEKLKGVLIETIDYDNGIVKMRTNVGNFEIYCSGGAHVEAEFDAMIPETVQNVVFDGYEAILTLDSDEEIYFCDETGGEGLELWRV